MRHLPIVVVVLVLIGVIWWLAGDSARDPQGTATNSKPPTEVEVVDPASAVLESDTAPERTELTPPADAAQQAPDPNTTVILGRCVDTDGTPLANVPARLHGWPFNQQRVDAHLSEHPSIEWHDPEPITTGPDGRFTFRIAPPPPYQFALDLNPRDFVAMHGRWSELLPAKVVDLGDIVFGGGVNVRGRVVDTDGLPREKVTVRLTRPDDLGPEGMSKRWTAQTRAAADGSFTFAQPFAPGSWSLRLDGAKRVTPKSDQVDLAPPEHVLDVVVETAVPMATIEGIVVDEAGAPVQFATVGIVDGGRDRTAMTRPNGRFSIQRPAGEVGPEKLALQVQPPKHEPLQTEAVHAFGDKDVRLVLPSGLSLEIIVRRNADGTPVEDFSVRLLPKPGSRQAWTSFDDRVRGGHRHEHGIARLTGIRRGPYLLVVEPAASTGFFGAYFVETNVVDNAPSVIHIRLDSEITQRVVVERSDGNPVPGSEVELLLAPPGVQVTIDSLARTFKTPFSGSPKIVLRVDGQTTAADGSCELRGGRTQSFGVRVNGKGHMTTVVADVQLGEVDPLRIVVPSGAELVGRLTPAEAVADFRELAGLPRTGPLDERQSGAAPSVKLRRRFEGKLESVPTADSVLVAEDGTFVIAGIPAGTWDLSLTASRKAGSTSTGSSLVLHTGITFADGESKESTFDITSRRYGRLRAVVMLDGMPFEGSVQLDRIDESGRVYLTGDAAGRLDALIPPGQWTASLSQKLEPQGHVWITSPETATVTPGESVEVTFRAQIAHAKVRVLSADGEPAVGVPLTVHAIARGDHVYGAKTDADGTLEIWLAPATYEVRTKKDADSAQVRIGEVTLPAAAEIVLRLPE